MCVFNKSKKVRYVDDTLLYIRESFCFLFSYTTHVCALDFTANDYKDNCYFPKIEGFTTGLHKQSGERFKIIDFIQIIILLHLKY